MTRIKACLTSIPVYHFSMYRFPKNNIGRMGKSIRKKFRQGSVAKKKYHMVRWPAICRPKKKGGLGIHNLERFSISLLCKWWWNLENKEGMWPEIVKKKYRVQHGIY